MLENNGFILKEMKKTLSCIITLIALGFTACTTETEKISYEGQIYLYGEFHGVEKIIEEELKIWQEFYRNGMRHLFLETSYFTAEYLNVWMQEDHDETLYEIYSDWVGTAPFKVEEVTINGKKYTASFFGEIDLKGCIDEMESGEYWRLENAYDDFKDYRKRSEFLPYDFYPLRIKRGDVFMIIFKMLDGRSKTEFYIFNGRKWQNKPATENIIVD